MKQYCVYCQGILLPGERLCQHCGRRQPLSRTQPQPDEDQPGEMWEAPDPRWARTSGPTQQGMYRREGPPGPSYRQSRPSNQYLDRTVPPRRQNRLALKILVGALAVAVVGLGGGAIAVVLAQGGNASPGKQGAASGQTATTAPGTPTALPSPGGQTTPTPTRAELCAAHNQPALAFDGNPGFVALDYPLPDDLPLKPVTPPNLTSDRMALGNKIELWTQLKLPPAGKTITVCKMTLKLIAFTLLAAPIVNVLDGCDPGWENPGGPEYGPCGAVHFYDGEADFTISTPQVGASMTAAVHEIDGDAEHPLDGPARLSTTSEGGGSIEAFIQVKLSGTYTFSVGLWGDDTSGPKVYNQTVSIMVMLEKPERVWGGNRCATPDMQAQLPPPTDQPGVFICPGDPPA